MAKGNEIWVCPQCGAHVDISGLGLYAEVVCPRCYYLDRVHIQLGNFRLESIIGIGGMSVVYRALDVTLNRPVALKVLNDTFRDQPERIERFENESAMMARVRHDNVTSVYSAGRAYGQFYIAMELVEGKNLEQMVSPERPLDAWYALEVVRQVALGLRAANEAGLLHRDMKPGNILITYGERVKVIDFGLALDNSAADQEEVIWATPYYVPPETLQRQPEDVRTDIYALGMTLKYLLTGVETFQAPADSVTALLACKKKQQPLSKQRPNLNPTLCDLADHMTEFTPARRPHNYDELLEEIAEVQQALEEQEAAARHAIRRHFTEWTVWAAAVAVLGLVAAWVASLYSPARESGVRDVVEAESKVDALSGVPQLEKALELVDKEEYERAAENLLVLARSAQDPALRAWTAGISLMLGHIVPVANPQMEPEAIRLLQESVQSKAACSPMMVDSRGIMQAVEKWPEPAPREWYRAESPWPGDKVDDYQAEANRIVSGDTPEPIQLALMLQLADHALWDAREDAVSYIRSKLNDTLPKLGPYAALGRLFERVFDARLLVRRTAQYTGRRSRIFEQWRKGLPTRGQIDELNAMAAHTELPFYLRNKISVEKEAALIAMNMGSMLMRKFPETCKKDMTLDQMLSVTEMNSQKRMIITSPSALRGKEVRYLTDQNKETLWSASGSGTGHVLSIKLPEETKIGKVVFDWEDNVPQTYRLSGYRNNRMVGMAEIEKKTASSTVNMGGGLFSQLNLSLEKTAEGRCASIREIELYDPGGKRLFRPETDPKKIVKIEADSEEPVHIAEHAMDGDMETRWCANNNRSDHTLTLSFPTAKKLQRISFAWENDTEQEGVVEGFQGDSRVYEVPFSKKQKRSSMDLPGNDVSKLVVRFTDTKRHWASIYEIELLDSQGRIVTVDGEEEGKFPAMVASDIRTVAEMMKGGTDNVSKELSDALTSSGMSSTLFGAIARSWKRRLNVGKDARYMENEELQGDRAEALKNIIERCRRCRLTKVNDNNRLRYLNVLPFNAGVQNVEDEQEALFLSRAGVVSLINTKMLPMLGLHDNRIDSFSLVVGEIQPVPEQTARRFEEAGSGVILNANSRLESYAGEMKPNPTSFLLNRVPIYDCPTK